MGTHLQHARRSASPSVSGARAAIACKVIPAGPGLGNKVLSIARGGCTFRDRDTEVCSEIPVDAQEGKMVVQSCPNTKLVRRVAPRTFIDVRPFEVVERIELA